MTITYKTLNFLFSQAVFSSYFSNPQMLNAQNPFGGYTL